MSMPSVLVIDDNDAHRAIIARGLNKLGISILFETGNSGEGIDLVAQHQIDLLIVNLVMPDIDGVRIIWEIGKLTHPPAVVLMSTPVLPLTHSVCCMAAQRGVQILAVVSKPLCFEHLKQLLTQFAQYEDTGQLTESKVLIILPQNKERLLHAMQTSELTPYFQPKINLKTGYIEGLEVLARWCHPDWGMLLPVSFLSFFENCNLDLELTRYILTAAIKAQKYLFQAGKRFTVSINISARLLDRLMLTEELLKIVHDLSWYPEGIIIELTETSVPDEPGAYFYGACRLRMAGFGLAIDDFGRGYGSIYHLISGPFTELKLDQQLVTNSVSDLFTRAALESSVTLGKRMGLYVVAEGVQDQDELDLITALGVDAVQSHFVLKPLTFEEIMNLHTKVF